jgi:hypothetical protein
VLLRRKVGGSESGVEDVIPGRGWSGAKRGFQNVTFLYRLKEGKKEILSKSLQKECNPAAGF